MAENANVRANGSEEAAPTPGIKRVMTDHGNKAQRLLRVDQIYSRKDRQVHFVKTAKATSRPDRFGKTALVVRRIISSKGMVAEVEVDIKSPHLERVLKEMFKEVPGLKLNDSPPIASPELLCWASPALFKIKEEEKLKPEPDQGLINDIGTALRFVDEDFGGQLQSLDTFLAQEEITFDLLWILFPPFEKVIAINHGTMNQTQVMHLYSAKEGQNANGARYFEVSGWVVTHDGLDFGKGTIEVQIPQFDGAVKPRKLPVYPLKFYDNVDSIRQQLIARGKKYIGLLQTLSCKDYSMLFGISEKEVAGVSKQEKCNVKGRIMVDPVGFREHNADSVLNNPPVYAEQEMSMDHLTDDDYFLCAYWIAGFSFTHKVWCQIAVEGLQDVQWNASAFDKLVIDEDRKQLIHTLVKAHRNDDSAFDDIVQNKGQGLVGLLSGTPGVGKTLTAEAVAEVTQRPLYMVSTGELGIEADTVDERLGTILEITRRWGCVLLIDEADVFLATRGVDLVRDSLVSIFLRRLEYFRGVCILTTNRKSEIDTAFQSRIHFTLHYPDLDAASRKRVWNNFISMIARNDERMNISDDDLISLARHELNGRQIKNIVSCAVSLARENKTPITPSSLEKLIGILIN
jgi:hypothetical protein